MPTPYQPRNFPAPVIYPDNVYFWQCASEGKLLVKRCTRCSAHHWYPRPHCPFCASEDTHWVPASGLGTIYSVSVTRRVGPIPYAIAYVTLDEGVTMLTNIVDCDLDRLRIGDRVRVVFRSNEAGTAIPMFAPL